MLAAGPAAAQQAEGTGGGTTAAEVLPEVRCACRIEISFADPRRYQYWRRGRVDSRFVTALAAVEGRYRAGRLDEMSICSDVRVPRAGDLFRSVDLCLHLDEWLQHIREEARCLPEPEADPAVAAAQCRLPRLVRDGKGEGEFATLQARGATPAEALCNAFAEAAEHRLVSEVEILEGERLHGLPDIRHAHMCRPL